MKKILVSIVLALMVIALPVGLIGCKKSNNVAGKYTFENVELEGELSGEEKRTYSQYGVSEGSTITLNKDGTGKAEMVMTYYNSMTNSNEQGNTTYNFNWKIDGTKFTATFVYDEGEKEEEDPDSIDGTIENGVMTFVWEQEIPDIGAVNYIYTFKK